MDAVELIEPPTGRARYASLMADLGDFPDLPRAETPEAESAGLRQLSESFARVEQLHEAYERLIVRPATSLAGDDNATPFEHISHQVDTLVGVALDNLRTVKVLVADARVFPAFAHFGLLRNALEAAGTGLWLLGPSSRDERVLRSLQLAWEDRQDEYSLELELRQLPYGVVPASDNVVARLAALRDMRTPNRARRLKPESISKRLSLAQAFVPDQEVSLLAGWKLLSGVSHGRRRTFYNLLDREVLSTDLLGASIRLTSSAQSVASMHLLAEKYLLRLMGLMLERGSAMPQS